LAQQRSRFERRKAQDAVSRRDEALAFESSSESWRPPEWFDRVSVVLVETTDPVNVGGVVRAMANNGFLRLRLVSPVSFDPWQVVGVAHYTQHILEASQRFDTLTHAVADSHFVLGMTGRHHRVERNALAFQAAIEQVMEVARQGQEVAVVFGREDWGMSNAMLDACHAVTTIPTNPAYPSLNLAQAVLLVLYQLCQRAGGQQQSYRPPRRQAAPASSGLLEDLFADLERALDAIEFLGDRPRTSILRSLRVALFRARLDAREASLLRAIAIEVRRYLHRKGLLSEVGPVGARPTDPEA
jgi:tRNA (cytidine32/uridine32-2'-O)-methyltransferase